MRETKYTVKYTTGFQKGLQAGNQARPENRIAGTGRGAAVDGRTAAGEEPRSRFVRRLGGPSGMSHSPGLAAHLPHRG